MEKQLDIWQKFLLVFNKKRYPATDFEKTYRL